MEWKGREYNYGKLIYDGEYLNGQKNGQGKEYDNGKLIYEGEYLMEKKMVKERDIIGMVILNSQVNF